MLPSEGRPALSAAISSLIYLDLRRLANQVRLIVKEPRRLFVWLFFLTLLALFVVASSFEPKQKTFIGEEGLVGTLPVPSIILTILGVVVYISARRAPGIFASPADGRFLIGSGISPRIVVPWLQLRSSAQYAAAFLPWLVVMSVSRSGPDGLSDGLAALAALTLTTLIVFGLRLPVFVAARRWGAAPFVAIGIVSIMVGLAGVGAAIVRSYLGGVALLTGLGEFAPSFPPGSWVMGALSGDGLSTLALFTCALALAGATTAVAGDSLTELWEASTHTFALRAAAKQGGARAAIDKDRELRNLREGTRSDGHLRRRTRSSDSERVPAGAWTLLWKEWLDRARRTTLVPAPVWYTLAGMAMGAGLGIAARFISGESLYAPLSGAVSMVLIIAMKNGSVRLSGDLSKPLWGLSAAPMRARLAVQMLAATLFWTVPVGGGLVAFAIVAGNIPLAIWGLPLVGAAYWLLHASSLMMYTWMPAGGLMSQPMMILRTLGALFFLIPVGVVALGVTIAAALFGLDRESAIPFVLGTMAVGAAMEGWLLVHLAAVRMRERGLEFALAE